MWCATHLWYAKKAQQIGNLEGNFRIGAADNAGDHFAAKFGSRRRFVAALEGRRFDRVNAGSDELKRLVERVGGRRAGIEQDAAQLDARQEARVLVDAIQRVEHRLEPLDASIATY